METQTTTVADKADAENNKAMAIVGYIFPFLFFLPLVMESSKNSPFARFHANQQLMLLIAFFAIWIVGMILALILIGFLIWLVGYIFLGVCIIMGIINAVNGQMKKLPLIGGFTILK